MIPQELVQKVIDSAEIVDVISQFVMLHKSGANYKGLCPFHNEKTPSFMVSPSKQIYKCFGCGESGTAVSFLMKHENFTFVEAIKWLGKRYGIEVEEQELTAEQKEQQKEQEILYSINNFAQKYFANLLMNTPEGQNIAYKYLSNRGLTLETIKKFQLGYSLEQKSHFATTALSNGYTTEILQKSGLVVVRDNDGFWGNKVGLLDRFSGRIIFPIHSLSGQVIGFGGRTMSADKNIAKYINSPETAIYNKSKSLYGIFFAKNEIVKKDKCYLVEGYMDVISMHQSGITNAIASSGTSLTEEQIRIIRRFTKNITLLFDADSAGQKATYRGIELALKEGMNVKILRLPQGEDPDTFCQKYSLSQVLEYFDDNEVDFLDFLISQFPSALMNDTVKKSQFIESLLQTIANIDDNIKRDEYLKRIASVFGQNFNVLYSTINKILNKPTNIQASLPETHTKQISEPRIELSLDNSELYVVEKQLLQYLLRFGDYLIDDEKSVMAFMISEIESEGGFRNNFYKEIFEFIKENKEQGSEQIRKMLINSENEYYRLFALKVEETKYSLSPIWEKNSNFVQKPEDTFKKDIIKALVTYKIFIINEYLNEINKVVNLSELPEDEKINYLSLSNQLLKTRRELLKAVGNRLMY